MSSEPINKEFYQKELFWSWAVRNERLFSHQPYLLRQGDGCFVIGFRGVSRHITCHFSSVGQIEVAVHYRKIFFDIIEEFDLFEDKTPAGCWVCTLCRDHPHPDKTEPLIEYKNRHELWIEHSFAPLATWTRKSFTRNARYCLGRDGGITWARIFPEDKLNESMKNQGYFKTLPVLTSR